MHRPIVGQLNTPTFSHKLIGAAEIPNWIVNVGVCVHENTNHNL